MPPRTKFNKEAIVEAAFDIAKEEGISGITTCRVANHLGCSAVPIFYIAQKNN